MGKMREYQSCELCGRQAIHKHHVYGAANRKWSEQYGMVAWLCLDCHTGGPWAVHNNRATDLTLKIRYQRKFEAKYSREMFMREFGRNYLDD